MDINRTVHYFVSTNYTNNACLDLINSRHYYSFNIQISFIQYLINEHTITCLKVIVHLE